VVDAATEPADIGPSFSPTPSQSSSPSYARHVILTGKSIIDQLPRKKSSRPGEESNEPELPSVCLMKRGIEWRVRRKGFTRADICAGEATDSVIFSFGDLVGDIGEEEDTEIEGEGEEGYTGDQVSTPRLRSAISSSSHSSAVQAGASVLANIALLKKKGVGLSRYSKSLRSGRRA
jgi:hypothetical protein